MWNRAIALSAAALLSVTGCGDRRDASGPKADVQAAPSRSEQLSTPKSVNSTRPKIVILGDSLTAGLGLPVTEAYPSLLQARVNQAGFDYDVVNAGVSGDTSAGGLSRLEWALQGDVRVLIVALGGNDALRGLPAAELRQNLAQIIERAQERKIVVLLAGMEAPPNFGQAYTVSFHKVYPDLAARYRVRLVPFLLDGVAGIESLNQSDGIHPSAEGARIVADNVWAALEPTLKDQEAAR